MRSAFASALPDVESNLPAIRISRLPHNYDNSKLQSLLAFTDRLAGTEFVAGDSGFKTAIARFRSAAAANHAQSTLDGKKIGSDSPSILVEIIRSSPGSIGSEQRPFDPQRAPSGSSAESASRFGSYSNLSKASPQDMSGYRSPPREDYFPNGNHRVTGRDVIDQDGTDDETSSILRDPIAFASNGLSRRNTDASRYNSLSLNTTQSPPMSGYTSPPHNGLRSPVSNAYQVRQPQFPRHNMPPVNPADQNPPCNTLYVGNLPIDTSEDELKALFSKQRGYKRLCFRTKQNGPMCFVEFEDVSFATKSLNDLYGYPLHNSAHRGGIRLSFSKNPLGVRSGGPPTPMSTGGSFPVNGMPPPFSAVHGPPPGIPAPPGLPMSSPGSHVGPNTMGFPGTMSPKHMGFGMPDMSNPMTNPYANGWQGYPAGR